MSYTNNQTNSSSDNGSNVGTMSMSGAMNFATDNAEMVGMSNTSDTHFDNDDIMLSGSTQATCVFKYTPSDKEILNETIHKMKEKMESVSKHIKLLIQREALKLQASSNTLKKRKRKRQSEK